MKNIGGLLKQAQQMQKKMKEVEESLSKAEVEGTVSGGLVTVIMSGKGDVKRIKISTEATKDIEILEDLIVAACSDAKRNADRLSETEMRGVTGGMPLPPGMKLS